MSKKLIQAAAGAGGESVYVEDVFSTYLYEGNGSTQTITNDIDLDGEGGLVWLKSRGPTGYNHYLYDTNRGATSVLFSNLTNSVGTQSNGLTAFNNNGFTQGSFIGSNGTGETYTSWTFRKQAGFFDVVTWTGDGTNDREISHNLGSVPGFIIIKSTSNSTDWITYHRSYTYPQWIRLNSTDAQSTTYGSAWSSSNPPTSTGFTLGSGGFGDVNYNGRTYVAYVFAHDDQSFGDNSDESIIKCGSYTGTGSSQEINLGFEPQWILIKNASSAGGWVLLDTMRGWANSSSGDNYLFAHSSSAEAATDFLDITATGFIANSASFYGSGETYIYIAIRRPMKTPESGTEVFAVNNGDGSSVPGFNSGFPVDMAWERRVNNTDDTQLSTRLLGATALKTNDTSSESSASGRTFDYMDGWLGFAEGTDWYSWMFKRATGFFDVVAYTGDRSSFFQTITHNLQVSPELVIIKARNNPYNWFVNTSHLAAYNYGLLNLTNAFIFGTAEPDVPIYDLTETTFKVGDNGQVNATGGTFIAYLFATLDGVSKVGSYTGTGSNVDVDCGFSAGARFILIKRTDSTGDWYVWDSERGIVAGNDPYLLLNSTAAEVTSTDYIDPLSSGFTVTSSAPAGLNASGGTYIFLAIS